MRELQELFDGDGEEYESEYRVRSKDGSTRWHLARGTVLRDPNGKPVRFIGTSTDITELKRAEEALRESEQRWRSLTEALPQLVWSATPDGTCDYFSSQWTEHTGVAEAELLGWRWLETLHPDDREPTRRFWLESVAGHHAYDIEYRVRRRDGEYRWFKTRGVPIRDTGGNIVKWFGTCTDITGVARQRGAVPRHFRERRRRHRPHAPDGPLPARQRKVLQHRRLPSRGTAPEDVPGHHASRRPGRQRRPARPRSMRGESLQLRDWKNATSARTARPSGPSCSSRSSATRRASPLMPSR